MKAVILAGGLGTCRRYQLGMLFHVLYQRVLVPAHTRLALVCDQPGRALYLLPLRPGGLRLAVAEALVQDHVHGNAADCIFSGVRVYRGFQ